MEISLSTQTGLYHKKYHNLEVNTESNYWITHKSPHYSARSSLLENMFSIWYAHYKVQSLTYHKYISNCLLNE